MQVAAARELESARAKATLAVAVAEASAARSRAAAVARQVCAPSIGLRCSVGSPLITLTVEKEYNLGVCCGFDLCYKYTGILNLYF